MNITIRWLCFLLLFQIGGRECFSQSVDMRIPFTPQEVTINGKPTLYYELHLSNFASDTLNIKKLQIMDVSDSTLVVCFEKEELKNRFSRIGVAQKDKYPILAPGNLSVIYLEFALPTQRTTVSLIHRLEFERLQANTKELLSIQGALTQIAPKPAIILGPPLSNGPWAAVYQPAWERGHRRVIYTIDGKARIPGRFAIDFIKLDAQGRYAIQDNNVVKNWYGYAMNVLAVNDGMVVATRDDFPESTILSAHPAYTAEKATGNFISLDIGNNYTVFYEHLKPGSLQVKPGQPVKKGDIIAQVGFTGQTTGPHLHFHVADGHSPLGAEGIGFGFDAFTVLGTYPDFEKFGKQRWEATKVDLPSKMIKQRPVANSVIVFDIDGSLHK